MTRGGLVAVVAVATSCTVAAFACKKGRHAGSSEPPEPQLEAWLPADATSPVPPPGPVYLAVKDQGIAVIDDNGSRLVAKLRYGVGGMTVTPDGELLFTSSRSLYALRDGAAVEIASADAMGLGSVEGGTALIVDPKGRLWVAGSTGTLTMRSGDRWSPMPKQTSGLKLEFARVDLLIDAGGALWIAADDFLYRQVGDGQRFEEVNIDLIAPHDYERDFHQLAMTADGTVVAALDSALYARVGDTWKKAELGGYGTPLLASHGSTIVASLGANLHRVTPKGVDVVRAGKQTYVASDVFAVEMDGAGRTWMATDNGLVVVAVDGSIRQWTPGTLPGVLGRIESIAIVGAGPSALPTPTEVVKGTIEGGFTRRGKPFAGLTVQMCESPAQVFQKNPCEHAVLRWKVVTGANGRFRFVEVPVGTYGLTWMIGGKWYEYRNFAHPFECCTELEAGATLDVGVFDLDR